MAPEKPVAKAPEEPIEVLLAKASIDKGKSTAKQCQACHTFEKGGPNRVGPNLWGIVGEPRGKGRGGFDFSAAMKAKGGNWTFEELNKFLEGSARLYPGHENDLRRHLAATAARRRDRLPAHAVGQPGAAAEGGGSRAGQGARSQAAAAAAPAPSRPKRRKLRAAAETAPPAPANNSGYAVLNDAAGPSPAVLLSEPSPFATEISAGARFVRWLMRTEKPT